MALKDVWALCEAHDYPTTAEQLASANSDAKISHPGGDAAFSDVIEETGETEFENADEAAHAIYGVLPAETVGRIGYSDRDPAPMGVSEVEPQSF